MAYSQHQAFRDPDGNHQMIWRYMDIEKFQSLIDREQLFFPRASVFLDDPFEGTFLRRELEFQRKQMGEDGFAGLVHTAKYLKDFMLVNCWHYSAEESIPMWRLYGKEDKGIAIVSSFDRFKDSFANTPESVHIGKVLYRDYENDILFEPEQFEYPALNFLTPYICKRNDFTFEKEYRAVISYETDPTTQKRTEWAKQENPNGRFINVNLNSLIEDIYITPFSKKGFLDQATEALQSKFPGREFKKSKIDKEPYWG